MDEPSVDGLFERNADMRLLEFRHRENGRTSTALRNATAPFDGEPESGPPERIAAGPRLRVTIVAVPAAGVIAGAVIGVAIDVHNDGNTPAPEVTLVFSLPLDATFRPGTLRVDGREPNEPERLFGRGLSIAHIPGSSATKIVFSLLVQPGLGPLVLQPRLEARGVPVVGAIGVSVKRRAVAGSVAPPRPFYEPDDDDGDADLAPSEAESPMLPQLDA